MARKHHLLFIFVTLMYWISLYIYVPILSPYLESMHISYFYVGIVLGSYGFMQILIRLPLGILSDRMRVRKPYILLGMITVTLSCILFAAGADPGWALAGRAMSGVAASSWVAFTVLYAGYFAKEQTTHAMGTISFLTVAGQCAGMVASGWLAGSYGWNAAFWTGAVIGLIGLAAAFGIYEPREGVYREPIRARDLTLVMKEPALLKASVLSILAHIVLFVTMFGFTPSYALGLGASKNDLSLVSFAFMVPHALASLYTGRWLAPRFGVWRVLLIGFALSSICTLAIPFTRTLGTLMLTQALNGFAQGLHLPLLMALAIRTVDQEQRATAMGFYQAVYALGMFGGPFIAGWINESFSLAGGFYFAAIAATAAVLLGFLWRRSGAAPEQLPKAGKASF
ncbi:MFS transporter [Paenibacillus gansuensis]|uniref:MFS transporter n=1 Tax=Paenibacillus gansuensis TaxID=306542 RepID=A0ABW5PED6_9BACL